MLVGNTVILKAEFKDSSGNVIDVTGPKVTIYDHEMEVLTEATPSRVSEGVYNYKHILTADDYIYEFSGEIDDYPSVGRQVLTVSGRL